MTARASFEAIRAADWRRRLAREEEDNPPIPPSRLDVLITLVSRDKRFAWKELDMRVAPLRTAIGNGERLELEMERALADAYVPKEARTLMLQAGGSSAP
jgi:hypothetical protein